MRAMHLVLLLFTAGRTSADGFQAPGDSRVSDAWPRHERRIASNRQASCCGAPCVTSRQLRRALRLSIAVIDGHWCLVRASSLGQTGRHRCSVLGHLRGRKLSARERVRPVDAARGPPPAIRTSVRSTLYGPPGASPLADAGAAARPRTRGPHSVAILGACGLMLWALVYTLSTKVGCRQGVSTLSRSSSPRRGRPAPAPR